MSVKPTNTRPAFDKVIEKLDKDIARVYAEKQRRAIREVCLDGARLAAMQVNEFMEMLAT